MTECFYFPKCTGCNLWNLTYSQQKIKKILYLQSLLKSQNLHLKTEIDFISCGEHSLRHRVDFTIEYNNQRQQHEIGFYDENKNLIHIKNCLQLSPELQKIYSEFSQFSFFYGSTPVKKGSVRLRTGPNGLKGCWLDFSNIEIKHLLEDKKLLNSLLTAGFIVEIGQKSKRLQRHIGDPSVLKLSPPEPEFWFCTLDNKKQNLDLKCLISDFTQPSWLSAKTMVQVVSDWLAKMTSVSRVLEFGPGIGQFTLCFLAHNLKVDACEINQSALQQLNLNAHLHKRQHNLITYAGDFHTEKVSLKTKYDLVFVNPARSGLKDFSAEIIRSNADYLIYLSCFPETLASDLARLSGAYELCNIKIIDQFPQTEHFETYTLLKKIGSSFFR